VGPAAGRGIHRGGAGIAAHCAVAESQVGTFVKLYVFVAALYKDLLIKLSKKLFLTAEKPAGSRRLGSPRYKEIAFSKLYF